MRTVITSALKTDGYGAQLLSRMTTFLYCKENNLIYHHTPIRNIAHEKNEKDAESFFSFKENNNKGIQFENIPERFCKSILSLSNVIKVPNKFYNIATCHWLVNNEIDKYYTKNNINILRNKYYSTLKQHSKIFIKYKNLEKTIVAIHIRRNDIVHIKNRFIPLSYYVKFINFINTTYSNVAILIYTDSKNYNEFYQIKNPNVEFVKTDFKKTFHDFVESDILLLSISSFSYTAALISNTKVYYKKCFMYNGLKDWIEFN